MYLHELAMDNFVLLQASWSVKKATDLIEGLEPSHVIVRRTEPKEEYYYLYTKDEALGFRNAPPDMSVRDAFDLPRYQATPAMDAYEDAETDVHRIVILDEGRVIGFYDVDVKPSETVRHGPDGPVSRSLVTRFPEKVPLNNKPVTLWVSLSAESMPDAATRFALPIDARVDVIVLPERGFVLAEGKGHGSLVIKDQNETSSLKFKLIATEEGPGRLQVLTFHKEQSLGAVTLAPTVVSRDAPFERGDAPQWDGADPRRREQPTLPVVEIKEPDLHLVIWEHKENGNPAITFSLSAWDSSLQLNLKLFGPIPLYLDRKTYFHDFYKDIEIDYFNKDKFRDELRTKGAYLFEKVIPTELQKKLWSLQNKVQTVLVQSQEPWIPWELCKLVKTDEYGNVLQEGPFLCEAFAMTRWIPGLGFKPTLTLNKMALVVPKMNNLTGSDVSQEKDYVLKLAGNGREVDSIPARELKVKEALASGKYDGWHFMSHGVFRAPDPDRSAIKLERRIKLEEGELTPEDLSGVVKKLGLKKPLVFMNACQLGRSDMALTDVGGWPARFLEAGAGAFIGGYWPINTEPSHEFTKALYGKLLDDKLEIGEAVREARRELKQKYDDPTWLAYVVFAHPLTTVQ